MQLQQKNLSVGSVFHRRAIGGTLLASIFILAAFTYKYAALPKSLAYTCFRGVSKQGMLFKTRNWPTIESDNFIVRYTPDDKDIANLVLETAKQAYQPVNEKLNLKPGGKILVLVYPNRAEMGKSFGWDANQNAMGVYWAGVIRILSPHVWIKDVNGQGVDEVFKSSGPMVHEYTHLVVDYITRGNYTRWLTEGIAQYVEREVTGFVFTENLIHEGENWYDLKELDAYFDDISTQSKAYRQSLAAVDCLIDYWGEESLNNILRNLGHGVVLNKTMEEELGVSLSEFEAAFRKWARENTDQ